MCPTETQLQMANAASKIQSSFKEKELLKEV